MLKIIREQITKNSCLLIRDHYLLSNIYHLLSNNGVHILSDLNTEKYKHLSNIKSPADIKKLSDEDLELLAGEIRAMLIDTVSQTGGHLAPNLGVVELTIALHKCFNSPHDKIIFDVGHQAYVHKLLTGRFESFQTLRSEKGISGFPRPSESEHDIFAGGHSSTALSSALGIAAANHIRGDKHYAIAVIGDGAFTGGMIYEAMNNVKDSNTRLIVILNNNEMSISPNVGRLAEYFAVIKSRPAYFRFKQRTEKTINRIPLIGRRISKGIYRLKTNVKNLVYKSTFFEEFGFRYMGPIDGHNIEKLCDALQGAKEANYPILLNIKTVKGKGYEYAENNPTVFHGVSKFDIDTGEPKSSGTNFSNEFGVYLCEVAAKDRRVCAISAAMTVGTGLSDFAKRYPERFFDVGIAEQHAVTFALGLSKGGMVPVFAVYSAFLQRAYDQLVHDGALQGQKIIIGIDRAGFVGDDGEMHHGLLDVPFMNTIPEITVYSPSTYAEMRNSFYKAFYKDSGVVAVRYYRGRELPLPGDYMPNFGSFQLYGSAKARQVIVCYGRLFSFACEAAAHLKKQMKEVLVLKLNRIKPLDIAAVRSVLHMREIFFFEEGEKSGGIGETFLEMLCENNYKGSFYLKAVEDCFVHHASIEALLHEYCLDTEGMIEYISRVDSCKNDSAEALEC